MMAAVSPPAPKRTIEFGNEPEYYITKIRMEPAGGGNVRLFAYSERADGWHLLYTAVMPANVAIINGRQMMSAGAEAHNLEIWDRDAEGHA